MTAAIMALVGEGIAFKTACEAEGISERDGHNWLTWGEHGKEPFAAFYSAFTCARALGEITLHRAAINGNGGKGSSMAGWVLERRFREHYALPKADPLAQPEVKIIIEGGLPKRPT